MDHQVLYRSWRPRDFSELTGQDHIRRTLENAVLQDKVSHAYLFAGPRGTGKTTTARILAKVLNCSDREGVRPCGICECCVSISQGNALDVMEIDAASNRGIEHIRDLKEKTVYLPAIGKYRIFIIDEAHMLTTEAFNALLKTLEEPPGHVVFMLATTEAQRMPQTVLSRCQRFDFHKLSYQEILTRLEEILAGEGRSAEPDALALLIRQADGSMRDAISLLDQCLSYSLDRISAADTAAILGLVRQDVLNSLLSAIVSKDAPSLFGILDEQFNQGLDPQQLLREFAGYCRDMLILALCGPQTDLVIADREQRRIMEEQGAMIGASRLQAAVGQAEQAASGAR
ncbi:MAG: DNA polymerase III subunit gamma/tau, partial [Clostridiales bacterium]|nr:DNA polymerase III subunit gamma/tau [Clostridiales bacterium]